MHPVNPVSPVAKNETTGSTGTTGGQSRYDMEKPRIPVKLHRRVCLIQTEDAVLAEELLARKKLGQDIASRLTDRALLVRPSRVDAAIEELQKMGHTPQVVQ